MRAFCGALETHAARADGVVVSDAPMRVRWDAPSCSRTQEADAAGVGAIDIEHGDIAAIPAHLIADEDRLRALVNHTRHVSPLRIRERAVETFAVDGKRLRKSLSFVARPKADNRVTHRLVIFNRVDHDRPEFLCAIRHAGF